MKLKWTRGSRLTTNNQTFAIGYRPETLLYQVAAVCYRRKAGKLQFLLVSTSGGKWTFPKGCIDHGVSERETAAREAMEEAGALGRIEPQHFDSYLHLKRLPGLRGYEVAVKAYLMEVIDTLAPQKNFRKPTWYSAEEARRKVGKNRETIYADEMRRVLDRAAELIGEQISVEERSGKG